MAPTLTRRGREAASPPPPATQVSRNGFMDQVTGRPNGSSDQGSGGGVIGDGASGGRDSLNPMSPRASDAARRSTSAGSKRRCRVQSVAELDWWRQGAHELD